MPAIVFALALLAAGQTSQRAFANLGRYLDTGDSIYVVTKADGEVRGRVDAVTATSLRADVDGTVRDIGADEIGGLIGSAYGSLHPAQQGPRADSVVRGALLGWPGGPRWGWRCRRRRRCSTHGEPVESPPHRS